MALKKEHLAALAKIAKVPVDKLEAAIKDENEVDIEVAEDLTTFTPDELSTLKNNEYKNGKEKGVEMAVKDAKDKLNLDFQGKTIDGLVSAAQKKALEDAKIEPDKKVAELNDKIKTLQATVTDQDAKLKEKDTEVSKVKRQSELIKNVPAGAILENDEVIALMEAKGYAFEMKDGKLVASKDGKEVQDHVANPLPVKDVIGEFLKEKKLISEGGGGEQTPPGGRGPNDGKPPVKFGTLSEMKKHFESQGKSTLGAEFSEAVQKAVTENKEFALDK